MDKNIYELILSNETELEESVSGKVGTLVRKIQDKLEIHKKWDKISANKVYEVKDIPTKKYQEIVNELQSLQNSDKYAEYKIHYNKLCSLTGISKNHSIIVDYSFEADKTSNRIKIIWNETKKKITIPNGSRLYHMSQVSTITSLEPKFKGKSAKGYLYSSPRIYFTLKKEMPKYAADIKQQESTTLYTPKENITSAFVDPLVPSFSLGAIFVETNLPIKVEKVDRRKKDNKKEKDVKESVELVDDPVFESLEDFMNYWGITFADEEFEEGVKDKVGEASRGVENKLFIRKVWEDIKKNIKREEKTIPLKEKDKKDLKENYNTISNSTVYLIYKKAYDTICKFFGIPNKDVIIENIEIKDDKAHIRYSKSVPRKIIIPNDCQLLHVSPTKDITELKPTFRSRVKGKYLYPTKRVYFSIGKQVSAKKAGLEGQSNLNKYTPKEDIKTAYIDPSCIDYSTGAIFIDTAFPIPVKNINDEKKTKKVEESTTGDILTSIQESFDKGLITENEKLELEEKVLDKIME